LLKLLLFNNWKEVSIPPDTFEIYTLPISSDKLLNLKWWYCFIFGRGIKWSLKNVLKSYHFQFISFLNKIASLLSDELLIIFLTSSIVFTQCF